MEIMVKLTKDTVEKWCDENGYGLIKMYEEGDTKPLSKSQIKAEGIKGIMQRVSNHVDLKPSDLQKKSRLRRLVEPRQLAHKIAHKHIPISLSKIGFMIGRKDHATVLHSVCVVDGLISADRDFRAKYDELLKLYSL